MNKLEEIKCTLTKMALILRQCDQSNWCEILLQINNDNDDPNDPKYVAYKVLSLYGGMGSLSDIVLYKDGKMLKNENDIFDKLRKKLYDLCTTH